MTIDTSGYAIYIYIYKYSFHEPSTLSRQDVSMFFVTKVGPELTQCIINEHLGDNLQIWEEPMGASYYELEILNLWIDVGLINFFYLPFAAIWSFPHGCSFFNMITIGNTPMDRFRENHDYGKERPVSYSIIGFCCWIFFQVTDWPTHRFGVCKQCTSQNEWSQQQPENSCLEDKPASQQSLGGEAQPGRCDPVVLQGVL